MSLLMDALRRAEQDKTQSPKVEHPVSVPTADETLELTLIDENDAVAQEEAAIADPRETTTPENKSNSSSTSNKAYARQLITAGRSPRQIKSWLLYSIVTALIIITVSAYYFWKLAHAPTSGLAAINIPTINLSRKTPQPQTNGSKAPRSVVAHTTPMQSTPVISAPPPVRKIPKQPAHRVPASHQTAKTPAHQPHRSQAIHLRKQPRDKAVLMAAYEAYQNNRLAPADRLYHQVLQHYPRNRDALLGLAAIALRQKDKTRAVYYYRQLAQLNPQDPIARPALIELTTGEDAPNTISRLKEWIQSDPNNALLHFTLGNRYAGKGRWLQAQESYFQAYQLAPDNADFAFNLGVSLDRLNKKQLALDYYRQALNKASGQPTAFNHSEANKRIVLLKNELRGQP